MLDASGVESVCAMAVFGLCLSAALIGWSLIMGILLDRVVRVSAQRGERVRGPVNASC
jgi:hypothetical protein